MTITFETDLLGRLFEAGLLVPTGVPGLYGRSAVFEDLLDRLEALVSALARDDAAEPLRFPPALPRPVFERSGYFKSFPHLAGTVHAFSGDEREHQRLLAELQAGRDWTGAQRPTRLVLTPAACYPVYPVLAARGALPPEGALVDVSSWCFRHEPSSEPTRLQLFRMREQVRLGSPEQVLEFRALWLERAPRLVERLALPSMLEPANDPFFGRGGRVMATSQRDQNLKFELLIPILENRPPTACLSFNYHRDHFGRAFELRTAAGEVAHSACVGFGLERLALALLHHHGLDPHAWPAAVRAVLWS